MSVSEEVFVPRDELLAALAQADAAGNDNVVPLRVPVGFVHDDVSFNLLVVCRTHRAALPALGRWTRSSAWVDLRSLRRALKPGSAPYVSMRLAGASLFVDDQRVV